MTHPPITPVLAIDGGGTRCRIAGFANDIVTSVEVGSANVTTDFKGSLREISEGLEILRRRLGVSRQDLSDRPTFVGLAGVTSVKLAKELEKSLPFSNVRIQDDRPAALRGALSEADGFLVHCGTGSFFGKQIDGIQRFSGGWGAVLGDEASAQWIGRKALSATLESADGLREESELTRSLLTALEGTAGIVSFAKKARPADFGAIARQVTEACAHNDEVAVEVMQSGANIIVDTLRRLGWRSGLKICFGGGIGPLFAPLIPSTMQESLVTPAGSPLEGAISLAIELAEETRS